MMLSRDPEDRCCCGDGCEITVTPIDECECCNPVSLGPMKVSINDVPVGVCDLRMEPGGIAFDNFWPYPDVPLPKKGL